MKESTHNICTCNVYLSRLKISVLQKTSLIIGILHAEVFYVYTTEAHELTRKLWATYMQQYRFNCSTWPTQGWSPTCQGGQVELGGSQRYSTGTQAVVHELAH